MDEMPKKIGKYEIRSRLGEGGTGIVYEGYDPDIERRVAIKILHPHLVSGKMGEELLTRFKREAISAAKCMHSNIVTVLEYGRHKTEPYIVMEFVDGVSVHRLIRHRLKHKRGISLRRSLTIISQLLKALHAAHRFNIVHRDVKASNVLLLKEGGRVKLADFGMARITEGPDLTMIGHFIGTPRYMAPELRMGLKADARADIFSVARLFLELLRLMPKSSNIPSAKLPVIVNMPPGNRIDYNVHYPKSLISVLLKGLQVDPRKRYQSVLEFMQSIKKAVSQLQQKTRPIRRRATVERRIPVEKYPASDGELDSMVALLSDFMGPIATVIMEEHESTSASAHNLAVEISKEIPEQEEQEKFIRRWEQMSEFRRARIGQKWPETVKNDAGSRPLNDDEVDRMGADFAHYIGPMAGPLMQHYSSKTNDIDELVKYLGREIPDRKESQKFIKFWIRD